MQHPFSPDLLRALAREHGTPLWVYDAATIRERVASLKSFDVIRYAQKANSNVHVLRLMREQEKEGVLLFDGIMASLAPWSAKLGVALPNHV